MSINNIKDNIEDIKVHTKQYIDTNIEYYTLLGFKITTKASSFLIKIVLLSLFLLLSLMFLSFAIAFAIGNWVDSYSLGFLIVGGIYLLISLILFYKGGRFIDKPMLKTFSEIFFND
nr:phage holin family protein [uncultured Flavobacterium sp.]